MISDINNILQIDSTNLSDYSKFLRLDNGKPSEEGIIESIIVHTMYKATNHELFQLKGKINYSIDGIDHGAEPDRLFVLKNNGIDILLETKKDIYKHRIEYKYHINQAILSNIALKIGSINYKDSPMRPLLIGVDVLMIVSYNYFELIYIDENLDYINNLLPQALNSLKNSPPNQAAKDLVFDVSQLVIHKYPLLLAHKEFEDINLDIKDVIKDISDHYSVNKINNNNA